MRRVGSLLAIGALLLISGCGGSGYDQESTEAARAGELVDRAVEIAQAIEDDPDSFAEVLEGHGLTVEQYEQMMYDISADPELAQAYQAAMAD